MKYVQVAILAFLVVIAGLLVGIYQTHYSTATSAESEAEELFEPAQAPPQTARQPDSAGIAGKSVEPVTNRDARSVEPKPDPRRERVEPRSTSAEPATQQEASEVQDLEPVPESEIVAPQPASTPVPTSPEPAPAPEPRQPRTVTLPANLPIVVRLVDALSTDTNYPGDTFYAALDEEIMLDGVLVARKGANVEGRVLESQRAGRVKGSRCYR